MIPKRLVYEFGLPAGQDAGWRLKFDFMKGEPTVLVHLHWNEKEAPTHTFEIDASEIMEGLLWARRDQEKESG